MKKLTLKHTASDLLDALLETERDMENLKDEMQHLVHRMQDALGVDDIEMGIDAAHVLLSQILANHAVIAESNRSAA